MVALYFVAWPYEKNKIHKGNVYVWYKEIIMDINTVRQRLYDYVRVAEEKKLKAIYTIIENDIAMAFDPREDNALMADVKRRSSEMKSGKLKTYSLDETKAMARKKATSKKVA